ncbi:MAG: hypothetical protein Fur005_30210 [Roseiflexaceae bacterium]
MGKLRITYTKSAIGYSYMQKDTIRSLGLRKLNSSVIQNDTPSIRGMIFKVKHLVMVEELGGDEPVVVQASNDDLEIIEGIGPRIAGVLKQAGVTSFAQLAAMEASQISAIVKAGGVRIAHTESWPRQAALAADGKWDELKALQDTLIAGRGNE